MDLIDIIEKAKQEGRTALTEAESKRVLSFYGIPVVNEAVAATPEEAVNLADKFGYPAVLKGSGPKLSHKTERGLVRLNLNSREAVLAAAGAVAEKAGADLEGYLVQPMIAGRRELVAGLFFDPQFGPVVMLGLGGIFTEAIGDVTFRVAPVSEKDAGMMIGELKSSRILNEFRGEAPADRNEIIRALVGLSRLGMEVPDVMEADVNPLVIGPDGRVTAVDALIVLGKRPPVRSRIPADVKDLFRIFSAQSVAFVGASGQFGKWGQLVFTNVFAGGYEGGIHLVSQKGGEIAGRKVYKSVLDIPGKVDLGVVTVPAAAVAGLIPEFKAKGIRHMLLITAGFSETGEAGKELEKELVRRAGEAGIVILGPNTMGISSPHIKFYCTGTPHWPKPGVIGVVSQSGNLGTQILNFAEKEGLGIRAFSGSGNEAMITIEDYLAGYEKDEMTRAVVLYLESIKDGKRFIEQATGVSRKKPIIMLKGGRTEAGNRAAASHTGAMASNIKVFEAACRQAGVIPASQPQDLLDLSAAFSSLPLPKGRRVAVMTLGGGWGVTTTDACIESGLEVPPITDDLIAEIDEVLPPFWSRANPIDLVGDWDPTVRVKIIDALARWDGCDAILHVTVVGNSFMTMNIAKAVRATFPDVSESAISGQLEIMDMFDREFFAHTTRLMEQYGKPIIGVVLEGKIVTETPDSRYRGIAFPTPERTVKVLAQMVKYQQWLDAHRD
ncbi:MAG: acetate--CoA ligase family protein [Syntrophaceae bacterium]